MNSQSTLSTPESVSLQRPYQAKKRALAYALLGVMVLTTLRAPVEQGRIELGQVKLLVHGDMFLSQLRAVLPAPQGTLLVVPAGKEVPWIEGRGLPTLNSSALQSTEPQD